MGGRRGRAAEAAYAALVAHYPTSVAYRPSARDVHLARHRHLGGPARAASSTGGATVDNRPAWHPLSTCTLIGMSGSEKPFPRGHARRR